MREPYEWLEDDLQLWIREQQPESLRLEYKRSDALAPEKKSEIARDVSAMANSAGGVIIYGIDEQKHSGGPIRLDAGVDEKQVSRERIEQVIDSNIQRRIDGIIVHPVRIGGAGRSAYVIWVPQSSRAPHMAADHRYYKRLGTTTAPMEEYEIRDVGRRFEAPELRLEIRVLRADANQFVILEPWLSNSSPEPMLYATCRIYFEKGILHHLNPHPYDVTEWRRFDDAEMLWNGSMRPFEVIHRHWSIPSNHPILEGERYPLGSVQVKVASWKDATADCPYSLGWEIRAPRTAPKLQGLLLIVNRSGPQISQHTHSLGHP